MKDPLAKVISEIRTGHQMRKFGLRLTKYHALTWGFDGFVIARDNNFEENVGMSLVHHRYNGGVKKGLHRSSRKIYSFLG
ncbi:hypothetical protein NQ314_020155 [Rhamnusium bicolor]|uniref:Uncharacterized protein n=1 Tax=Rhamnusium bicolor TaxID=1586634 RepID=A0AAV8WMG2_9CUCU|nr:hypothetical protein NQ314_020155 [Rhamnusium bicolor]